jgi:dihydrolipoamide dehydrogenase
MSRRITILGAGPGGYVAAIRAAQLGAQVTLIERDRIGGTCLNWGCIPTKTLKTTAELLDNLRRSRELGVEVGGEARLNVERLMARKREVVETQAAGIMKVLRSHKVRFLQGEGRVLDPRHVRLESEAGETLEVVSDALLLATGSSPISIPSLPFDGERILSSSDALGIASVPESILIVGGGVIGCEFASIFSSLGSRVVLVEALSRLLPLPAIDGECSAVLQREMKKRKIPFHLNRSVERVDLDGERVRVTIAPSHTTPGATEKDARTVVEEVQKVLVCVGRQSNARGSGMEELGLEMDARGWIAANARMETNLKGVYAVGDALGPSKVMLAHVASAEGLVAAENAMGGDRRMDYDAIPSAVFTSPEIACAGLTQEQARERGLDTMADAFLFRGLGKAQALGEIAGQVKVVAERGTGRILGVHMIGPHATDLIAEGVLAIRMGITLEELASTIHAHPTLAEALMEAAHKALGAGIHTPKDPVLGRRGG